MRQRINLSVIKRFWSIACLYWLGDEKWKARKFLLVIIFILITYTFLGVNLNQQRGNLITALSELSKQKFWNSLLVYFGVFIAYIPLFGISSFLISLFGLMWRKWLTNLFLDSYFQNLSYYKLSSYGHIDNPDQRISQDVRSFTQDSLTFFLLITSSVFQLIGFGAQLWKISFVLVIFLLFYALVGTLITSGVFGRVLIRLNFEQLKREANFRFGLVQIRENAESIAFYQGEDKEKNQVKVHFEDLFDNFKKLILWQDLGLKSFTNGYQLIALALPFLILAPRVFSGELAVGKVTEAQGAFTQIFFSLNLVVTHFQSLTEFGAGINRIFSFANYINLTKTEKVKRRQPNDNIITIINNQNITIENLTLQTPNYEHTLVKNLTLDISSKGNLLIIGESGCGKSSLLRAIAGLWQSGKGKIIRPDLSEILFLPQRPYMISGSLLEQLIYPKTKTQLTYEQLSRILKQVNLLYLINRFGGLDAYRNWREVLSLGEQQRIAFARILTNQPRYVVLDEATSALDVQNEELLYNKLKEINSTYISVGHRLTLKKYHHCILKIDKNHSWNIKSQNNNQ